MEEVMIELPNRRDHGKFVKVFKNVFTTEECNKLIERTEAQGFEAALVNIGGGAQKLMTVRNIPASVAYMLKR